MPIRRIGAVRRRRPCCAPTIRTCGGMAARITARVVTYGADRPLGARLGALRRAQEGFGTRATVVRRHAGSEQVARHARARRCPGRHNVQNALAAVGVALELALPFAVVAAALGAFRGAERRFERKGEARGRRRWSTTTGITRRRSRPCCARRAPRAPKRLVCVFQPHRYSRTAQLLDEFGPALALADEIVLTDIYAAGEDPIPGRDDRGLADARRTGRAGPRAPRARRSRTCPRQVARLARPGDLVITLGAGRSARAGPRILEELARAP